MPVFVDITYPSDSVKSIDPCLLVRKGSLLEIDNEPFWIEIQAMR
jgi:hypothetical protein